MMKTTNAVLASNATHYLRQRWGDLLDRDPYYNQNCSTETACFEPGFPPRRHKPWSAMKQSS